MWFEDAGAVSEDDDDDEPEDDDRFESLSVGSEEEAWETSSEMEADVDEKDSAFEVESEPDFVLVETMSQLNRRWSSTESNSGCSCGFRPLDRS